MAVVVPIVAVVALVLGFLFFWRKRKARKAAEEQRKKEIEEYGFNPNHDPSLPPVGAGFVAGTSEMTEDNSGYRGWGAASSTQRKPSTHLSSGRGGGGGLAGSDTTSNPGGYGYSGAPSNGTAAASEGHSGDPLVNGETVGATAGAGAVGGAAGAAATRRHSNSQIPNRGPSNASSAYSNARADSDDGAPPPPGVPAPGGYYHEDGPYYNDAAPQHGPYGDGSYGGEQPVIRDVQARRNTRIERAPTFPQQGNSGIAQNF